MVQETAGQEFLLIIIIYSEHLDHTRTEILPTIIYFKHYYTHTAVGRR